MGLFTGRQKSDQRRTITYKKLNDEEVLVIVQEPGKEPIKTIVQIVPPESVVQDQLVLAIG